jgi:adenosylcobinamide-GDP ribazoletransferase
LYVRSDAPRAARRSGRPWGGLAGAIAFLTIVPVPAEASVELAASAGWFPVVGAAVGGLAGAVRVLCEPLLGRTPSTVLAMIALVVVTGALHLDGLADTADGLGARGERTRRLEVMRDSATGVFGALALIAWALLLMSTLASLDADRALRALIAACALARWAALLHALGAPPARPEGLGAMLGVSALALIGATTVSVILILAICGPIAGVIALGVALLVVALSTAFVRRTLGGRTGDTLGATVSITEVAVCAVLLAVWHT